MAHRNLPPEALAAIVAVKGTFWFVAGVVKLRRARKTPLSADGPFGMVCSSHRSGDFLYVATVEYRTAAGETKRLRWICDSEPALGQSVLLRPKAGDSGEMEVAQAGNSRGKGVLFLVVGLVLWMAAAIILS